MNTKLAAFALVLSVFAPVSDVRADKPELMLTIGVPAYGGMSDEKPNERWIFFGAERRGFPVVITNVSDKPIRLWSHGCSWGHDNLTFELTADDGTVTWVQSARSTWTANGPWFYEVAPQESSIVHIDFSDSYAWKGFPPVPPGFDKKFTMRAFYSINVTPEEIERKVWTGQVESARQKYRFLREK